MRGISVRCQVSEPCSMMHVYQKGKSKQGTGFEANTQAQHTGEVQVTSPRLRQCLEGLAEYQHPFLVGGGLGIKTAEKEAGPVMLT